MVRMVRAASSLAVIAAMGVVTAMVGAGAHRALGGWGVTLCLALMAASSVFARAWRGFLGLAIMGAAWVAVTLVLAAPGPGGSLLIAQDGLGLTWVYGGAAMFVIAAVLPGRLLVGDDERGRSGNGR